MATDTPQRKKYDISLLTECITRDKATLVGEYPSPNVFMLISFICPCGKEDSKTFRSIANKGGAFCKPCASIRGQGKAKASYKATTGFENPFENPDVKDAINKNYHEKTEEEKQSIIDSRIATIRKKTPEEIKEIYARVAAKRKSKSDEEKEAIRKKNQATWATKTDEERQAINAGREETTLLRLGVKNPFLSDDIKQRIAETNILTFGVANPFDSPEVQAQIRQDRFVRRGVLYATQGLDEAETQKRNNTRKETCQERFNYDNPAQVPSILARIKRSAFHRTKEYTLPSGNTLTLQGYEHYAVPDLLRITTEEDLLTGEEFGQIAYSFKGSIHQYTCDFYIRSMNKIIEIKSSFTLSLEPDKIKAKGDACKTQGYAYEIWVYNDKGERVETIVY